MKCKFCGYELYDDAVFCTNCGAKQPEETETTSPDEDISAAAPDTSADDSTLSFFDNDKQDETPDEITPAADEAAIEIPPTEELTLPTPDPVPVPEPVPVEEPDPIPEPAYVPPVSEPAYVPPVNEPAYVPPVSEPAYAPPVSEPAYVPPVSEPAYVPPVSEPAYVPPVNEPAYVPPVSENAAITADDNAKKVKKVGAGKLILAAIITILTICFLLIGNMLLCVKFGVTGDILSNRIKKLELNTILSHEYENAEISTDIYRTLGIRSITEGGASESSFKSYLIQSDALDFIAENVKNYADYILEGKGDDPTIDSDYIAKNFFGSRHNNKIAQQEFDYSFNSTDLNNIAKNLRKNDVDEALSISEWNEEAGFNLKNCRHVNSYVSIAIVFGIVLVLIICIILIVDKKGRHAAGFLGNIFSIAGVLTFIVGFAITAALPIVYTFSGNVAFYAASNLLSTFGIAALCTGFVEMLGGCIFHFIKKALKKKEKAAKAE